jgi:hypothetical protein
MKVKVEQRHIDKGIPKSSSCCAVALAVREVVGHEDVDVDEYSIAVAYDSYRAPRKVTEFIEDFDRGDVVSPFEFELTCDGP